MILMAQNIKATERLSARLIREILRRHGIEKQATVVALEGELGAGKSVFVRGAAKFLGIKNKIKSPTFVLIKKYRIPKKQRFSFLYHLDCYRLRDYRDLKILEIDEILKMPDNIVFIEWSERVRKILPKNHIKVHIDHLDKNIRKLTIVYRQ